MSDSARIIARLRLAGIALVLVVPVCLGGCIAIPLNGSGNLFPRPQAKSTETTTTKPAAVTPAIPGKTLKGHSWEVTVVRAYSSAKGPGGAAAGSGKTWVIVKTEFRNVGMSSALFVNPKDATLASPAGRKYRTVGTTPGYNGHGMRVIGPGLGDWTLFAFRVPRSESSHTFTFSPKELGRGRLKLQWGTP